MAPHRHLVPQGKRWSFTLYGSGDAEGYGATFLFDKTAILARTTDVGGAYEDEARYRYNIEPEVISPVCD